MALAERLPGLYAHSIPSTKRALNRHGETAARDGFAFALAAQSRSFDTPELRAWVRERSERPAGAGDG